jgi:Transposase DDE domain
VQEGRSQQDRQFGREELEGLMDEVFGGEVHAQRLASLTDGVDGVLHAASLGVRAIGQGLAVAQGLAPRHAIKQVDRLLSNPKLSMEQVFGCWVPFVVGERREIVVNFDWTEFEDADQCTVVLGMQTEHGRSTPLVWKTVTRSELKDQRNDHEDDLLVMFASVVPRNVRVTVVADRGFSDSKLYSFLTEALGFDYIIRFRGVVYVEDAAGERRKAKAWLGTAGRMQEFRHARVTAQRHLVPVVVCVQDKAMKEPWCLVSSRQDLTGVEIKVAYGRRFTVEETFRDVKNPRFGLGLKQAVIARNDRRDALFLLAVLAHTLLTLLGRAGQELGMDRMLGAMRSGQLSLFRQGLMLFELIPKMREDRLRALAKKFGELLQDHALFTGILGVI